MTGSFHRKLLPLAWVFALLLTVSCGVRNQKSAGGEGQKPELRPHVRYLDNMLLENSGLIHYDNRLWTINDSGGDPVLFSLDINTGKVIQAVILENAKNRDWESLAQDEDYIYICDIGNNYGRRKNLYIYKLAKDSIPSSGNTRMQADIISYTYAERPKNNPLARSAYDCEAAFAWGDSIYLFTKDWETRNTTLYTCSKDPGSYELEARKGFEVGGLITGVDRSPDSSFITFIGYKDYIPFIWILNGFNPLDYTYSKAVRHDYPEYLDLQTEGIAISSPDRIFISCEMTEFPAALFTIEPAPAAN